MVVGDDWAPQSRSATVYLCVHPPVDFEAHREKMHAEIKAQNAEYARKKAEEEKKKEEEAAAKAAAVEAAKVPRAA